MAGLDPAINHREVHGDQYNPRVTGGDISAPDGAPLLIYTYGA
jgi:hypothetical protein